jgi:hypothetical protein
MWSAQQVSLPIYQQGTMRVRHVGMACACDHPPETRSSTRRKPWAMVGGLKDGNGAGTFKFKLTAHARPRRATRPFAFLHDVLSSLLETQHRNRYQDPS